MTAHAPHQHQPSNASSDPNQRLVGHAERMAASNTLTEALGGGYLDLAEYDRRLTLTNSARTHADIREALRGLEGATNAAGVERQERHDPYTIDDIDELLARVHRRDQLVRWSNVIAGIVLVVAIFVWPNDANGDMSDAAGTAMMVSIVWLLGLGRPIIRAITKVSVKDVRLVRALDRLNPLLRAQQLESLRQGGRQAAESEYWVREYGRTGKWIGPDAE